MASEFGILLTERIFDETLEKTNCDVIITEEKKVKRKEVEGVLGYVWEETNHRFGLCEGNYDLAFSDTMYCQTKCDGSYPVFPHYIIDALRYGVMIDRNDNQVRVDLDDKRLMKIKIQPYLGEMYFSPENYSTVFCKRQALALGVDDLRHSVDVRNEFEETNHQTKGVLNGNKQRALEVWKEMAYQRMRKEGSRGRCIGHDDDVMYQLIKKLRYGMMYPHHYALNARYEVSNPSAARIKDWLLKVRVNVGRAQEKADQTGPLAEMARSIENDELSRQVVDQIIQYGGQFSSCSGAREDDIPINILLEYCESLTTFVHRKKRKEGDDLTARNTFRQALIKSMPTMNFKNQMKMTRGWGKYTFFSYIDRFSRIYNMNIDPNGKLWIEHKQTVSEQLKKKQEENRAPLTVQIDGVHIRADETYGTVDHWVEWVVDTIMLRETEKMIKDYRFKKLKREELISGMNKLEDGLRCIVYCLILALYDYYEGDIEGFKKGTIASSIVETVSQMFPNFRSDIIDKFGISLKVKTEAEELFLPKNMKSSMNVGEERGYKYKFGWKDNEERVMSDYGEILTESVEILFKKLLKGEKWKIIVDDPQTYFEDDLFVDRANKIFSRGGQTVNQLISIKVNAQSNNVEGTTYFSKRFVSYWFRIEHFSITTAKKRTDIRDKKTEYNEFDFEDFKPACIGELGIHASTYIYQDLLVGKSRGERVKDAKELVWMDLSLANFGCSRCYDRCWPASCVEAEISLRYYLVTSIFARYLNREGLSFSKILISLKDFSDRLWFPTYKHFYVAVVQKVLRDDRRLDYVLFCSRVSAITTRRATLMEFSTFKQMVGSTRLLDTLFLNFLLWIIFEQENIDVDFANKWHPLLISTEKGLRVIAVDVFNSSLTLSTSGWLPYLERICSESAMDRALTADEINLKRWFVDYYMELKLERRAEPRMSFKSEALITWIGSNCGGVTDYVVQLLPVRKPKPGLLVVVYSEDGGEKWAEWALRDYLEIDGSLGLVFITRKAVKNKSKLGVRDLKIYNRGRVDRLILISSGVYTFGNKFLFSKLLSKIE
ncbi:major outer capsid protein [African horse sickness virus 1]|uniref:Outer capsid protein VP2 n=1 Tax=African horse sickness virus 1 TaxID=33714 RepID=A0A189RMN4_AHSV1|nr:major outer capsid protein [African horse sickness virus 1]